MTCGIAENPVNARSSITERVLTYAREKKCRLVSPTQQALQPTHKSLYTTPARSPEGIGSFTPNMLPSLKDEKTQKEEQKELSVLSSVKDLFIYLFILFKYYNSQRFPITVNEHVKDLKQTHKKKAVLLDVTKSKYIVDDNDK